MNPTLELNNNISRIISHIKSYINGSLISDSSMDVYQQEAYDDVNDDDDDSKRLQLIKDILSDHSHYKAFIRNQVRYWYQRKHGSELSESVLNNFIVVNIGSINQTIIPYAEHLRDTIIHRQQHQKQVAEEQHERYIRGAYKVIDTFLKASRTTPKRIFLETSPINVLNKDDQHRMWFEYKTRWTIQKYLKQGTNIRESTFKKDTNMKDFSDDEKNQAWERYKSQRLAQSQASQSRPELRDTFSDKLNSYIVNHQNDPILDFDQFVKVTHGWSPDNTKPLKEWHQEYLNRVSNAPIGLHTIIGTEPTVNQPLGIGFKSPKKVKALKSILPERAVPDTSTPSTFPLKHNIKRYQLHKTCPSGTYLIDIMFVHDYAYLVAINVNTRYLFVECMNEVIFGKDESKDKRFLKASKDTKTFIRNLDLMIKSGMNVRYLQGDGEKSFNSVDAWTYYDEHGITFKPVPRIIMGVYPEFMVREHNNEKTDPMHGSLGIIDRAIRTLRDMAYNMKIGIITPQIMKDLVHQYNNAPHTTLSKYLKMDTSPQMVQEDPELEDFISRQILKENYNVMNRRGFRIPEGTPVKVYNEKDSMSKRRSIIQPGNHKVLRFNGGLYTVVDDKNNTQLIPRYKLDVTI